MNDGDAGAASALGLVNVGLPHVLVVAALLFALGLVTVASRRNAVAILMGVELMINGAALNFVAFGHYGHGGIDGQVFALFIIVMAAAGAAVALAIVLALYRGFRSIDTAEAATLKD